MKTLVAVLVATMLAPTALYAEMQKPRLPAQKPRLPAKEWKYRFTVPIDVHKVPRKVTKLEVECEICQKLDTSRSPTKCMGGNKRVFATRPVPLQDGETTLTEVELLIYDHLMVQTGMYEMGPTTKDLKWFCFFKFNGVRPAGTNPLVSYPAAAGSMPVLQVPSGDHPGSIPE